MIKSTEEALRRMNNKFSEEVEALKAELRAAEVTYGAYIDGLHKEIQELKAKPQKIELRDLSAEKAAYENKHWSDCAVNNAPAMEPGPCNCGGYPSKGSLVGLSENLIAFRDGSYKKIKFRDWKHAQWIHYTRPNGKNVRINPANVNYIEEI